MTDAKRSESRVHGSRGRRQLAINTMAGGAANVVGIVIQVIMLPTMARLVGPAEFGLYALALPTISFFSVLADGGLGVSLAREPEENTVVWSTAFWLLLATGITLAILVAASSVVIGSIAHQPRLIPLMALLSLSLIFLTMTVIPNALMTRRGTLVIPIWSDVVSKLIGAGLAVGFALKGAGVWSFAVQLMSGYVIRWGIMNIVASYRPRQMFQLSMLGSHVLTGGSIIGGRLTEFAGRMIENLIYGSVFGAPALGIYTFANQVPQYICQAVHNPVWGALYAHSLHESASEIGALHVRLCRLTGLVLLPIAFLFAAVAPDLFAIFLGPKWITAAPMVQILIPCYAFAAIGTLSGAILQANGLNSLIFLNVVGSTVGRTMSASLGIWTGERWVIIAVGLVSLLSGATMFIYPHRVTGVRAATLFGCLAMPALASIVSAFCVEFLLKLQAIGLFQIFIFISVGTIMYMLLLLVFDHKACRSDIMLLKRLARYKR